MDTGWLPNPPKIGEEWKMSHVHVRVDGFTEQEHIMMTYLDEERKESTSREPAIYSSRTFSEAWVRVRKAPNDMETKETIETIEI